MTPGAIWGQVRAGGVGSRVEILMESRAGRPFKHFKTITVGNPQGYFTLRTSRHAYRWRLAWLRGQAPGALARLRPGLTAGPGRAPSVLRHVPPRLNECA